MAGGVLQGGLVVAVAAAADVEEDTGADEGDADDGADDDDGDERAGGEAGIFGGGGLVDVDDAELVRGEEGVVERNVALRAGTLFTAGF